MTSWILVASGSGARIFSSTGVADFKEIEDFTNPANRQHESELVADRYGKAMTSASGRSESYEEPSARKHERQSSICRRSTSKTRNKNSVRCWNVFTRSFGSSPPPRSR